jgi:RNA polymerase sigma-70 factor (ECF subfamily)
VLAWRKKRQRDRLQFSDELLTFVATATEEANEALEQRSRALARCLEKLPDDQRELVRLRYAESGAIEAVARQVRRTVEATYRALSRIRHALHDCVTRTIAREVRT